MNESGAMYQSLRRKLVAGMLDSGLSSIATFLIGVIAIRNLSPSGLGVYSILFSAYLFGSLVPAEGYFVARELSSMRLPADRRLDGVALAMRGSTGAALVGSLAVGIAVLMVGGGESAVVLIPEALAAIGIILVAPMQDFLRTSFHLAERSGLAAVVAGVKLTIVIGVERVASARDLNVAGLPLVLLLVATAGSLLVGLLLVGRAAWRPPVEVDVEIDGRAALRSALYMSGAAFVASMIMAGLVGTEVVGYAEAARTLSQPIVVVGIGLMSAISSRSLAHTQARNRGAVLRVNTRYLFLLSASAILCVLPLFVPAARDWLADLLPAAFVVEWLVLASVVSNVVLCATFLLRDQLIKGGMARGMARVDGYTSVLPVLLAVSSPLLGAFARPVGLAAQNLVRLVSFKKLWSAIFQDRVHGTAGENRAER